MLARTKKSGLRDTKYRRQGKKILHRRLNAKQNIPGVIFVILSVLVGIPLSIQLVKFSDRRVKPVEIVHEVPRGTLDLHPFYNY